MFPTLHAINQWIWFCIYLHITSMQMGQEKNLIQLYNCYKQCKNFQRCEHHFRSYNGCFVKFPTADKSLDSGKARPVFFFIYKFLDFVKKEILDVHLNKI